jgi:hypothetical protein
MDYSKLSKEELVRMVEEFYSSPYIRVYMATKKQLDNIADEIEKSHIPFDEDNKLFKAFLSWGDKARKISEDLDYIHQKIDPEELKKAKQDRTKAKIGTLENFVKR